MPREHATTQAIKFAGAHHSRRKVRPLKQPIQHGNLVAAGSRARTQKPCVFSIARTFVDPLHCDRALAAIATSGADWVGWDQAVVAALLHELSERHRPE